jgi:hypothetical protein
VRDFYEGMEREGRECFLIRCMFDSKEVRRREVKYFN